MQFLVAREHLPLFLAASQHTLQQQTHPTQSQQERITHPTQAAALNKHQEVDQPMDDSPAPITSEKEGWLMKKSPVGVCLPISWWCGVVLIDLVNRLLLLGYGILASPPDAV